MTHLAITEHRDGARVQWMEPVSDEQYNGAPSERRGKHQGQSAQQAAASTRPQARHRQRPSGALQQQLAPGLATLTDDVLYGDVWRRPELSPRDRSLVTISVLIATGKPAQLAGHLGRALDNGVQPSEASGLLAHLAIYCGWPSAVSALEVYEQVYTARKIDTAALRTVGSRLPPPASDAARARAVNEAFGPSRRSSRNSPTTWCSMICGGGPISRCGIGAWSPSPHSLRWVTTTSRRSTCAGGSRAASPRAQITEAVTHLGFYAGWGRATRAMTAVARTLGR